MVCLLAAPWVQLSVSAGNGWPHNALQHHWLMPISCHFRDCKALLLTSLTHVSGAITSVQTFTFYLFLIAVDRYVEVLNGRVCCRDVSEDRVVVDYGDQCCAGVPYSSHGAQLCCNGSFTRDRRSTLAPPRTTSLAFLWKKDFLFAGFDWPNEKFIRQVMWQKTLYTIKTQKGQ